MTPCGWLNTRWSLKLHGADLSTPLVVCKNGNIYYMANYIILFVCIYTEYAFTLDHHTVHVLPLFAVAIERDPVYSGNSK